MKNKNEELLAEIERLEERIDIQILTLQVLRGHLDELSTRLDDMRKDFI